MKKMQDLEKIGQYKKEIKYELMCELESKDAQKDILIVVHNNLELTKQCIESIKKHTKNYTLLIWNNGSDKETSDYLASLEAFMIRSNDNLGFIKPNNRLAEAGSSPYLILLNNDTVVYEGWDRLFLGLLQANEDVALVGSLGGILDKDCRGCATGYGYDIDFVQGWGMCLERKIYDRYGLFDEYNLEFAFGEDSDYSLRLKEDGHKVYATYTQKIYHYGNATIKKIGSNLETFDKNHEYNAIRWKQYLTNK